ncbi:MAG: hypothetical protein Q8M29_04260 [Bacteroidota bacterium]|nr:hypothetical protein [Bacteroidota bacterium]
MKNTSWIMFDSEKTKGFSESFKKKMAEDLYPKIYLMLDGKVSSEEFDFGMHVGLMDMKMMESNGYVFILATLTTEFASSYYITIGWASDEFKDPLEIHKSDLTNKKVEFTWCTDFPKEDILIGLKPTKTVNKEESKYKFDIQYYLYTFPDVAICFDFEGIPTEKTLNALEKELSDFKEKYKTVFVHKLFKSKNTYIIGVNHNTIDFETYGDKEYKIDVQNLESIAEKINKNNQISNLKRIRFK